MRRGVVFGMSDAGRAAADQVKGDSLRVSIIFGVPESRSRGRRMAGGQPGAGVCAVRLHACRLGVVCLCTQRDMQRISKVDHSSTPP